MVKLLNESSMIQGHFTGLGKSVHGGISLIFMYFLSRFGNGRCRDFSTSLDTADKNGHFNSLDVSSGGWIKSS